MRSTASLLAFAALLAVARPLAAAPVAEPLLVATPHVLVFADGNVRKVAAAGTGAGGYRILGVMADGSVLVSYRDTGSATVEAIAPDLSSRTVKRYGLFPVAFIAPSSDGFLAYDGGSQLLRRYDARGSLIDKPIAPLGAKDALGIGDAIVVIAPGRLAIYDRGGRLRHETIIEADRIVALPGDRFAVTDTRYSEVRVYTTALELKSTMRFPNRQLVALAAGSDGSLAVANGHPSCTNSDVEVDVFNELNAQPSARLHANVGTPTAMAIGTDAIYVANTSCRLGEDGFIAAFGRDGSARDVIRNVGTPTGILALPPRTPK